MSLNTDATWADRTVKALLLIRILVGWVFLSEGIQKFLFPESLGVGRFVKIGIPWPQVIAPFVGVVEIVCGSLLLLGLITRLATVPLLIDISVAIYSTKIVTLAKNGFWGTLHEARTDLTSVLAGSPRPQASSNSHPIPATINAAGRMKQVPAISRPLQPAHK